MTDHPVKGVDHVFLLVRDLDASRDLWERLGFTISPRGFHSAHKGSANHTIMFPNDYVELLGLVAETEGNAGRRQLLAERGEGLHAVACRIDDAEAAEAALRSLGIGVHGRSSFSRPVPLPGGGETEAAFATLQFDEAETPLGSSFMCQHLTREAVWIPELMEHANGARAISAILAASDDPTGTAERFARLFAEGRVEAAEGGAAVATGPRSARIVVAPPEAWRRRLPGLSLDRTPEGGFLGLRIAVETLERARASVARSGAAIVDVEGGFAVGPEETAGAVLEFVEA